MVQRLRKTVDKMLNVPMASCGIMSLAAQFWRNN